MKECAACGVEFDSADWRCPSCQAEPKLVKGYLAFSPESSVDSTSFKADYFGQLINLEKENFWFRSRNRLIIWALARYFPKAKNLLEIGCGTGFVLSGIRQVLPDVALYGSDIFIDGLAFAQKRLPGVSLFQMDARNIPFVCEFDTIGAFDVLEHIDDDNTILFQMFKATRPGGGILITVPQHRFLWSNVDEYACHKRRYTRKELVQKVERVGFKIIRTTSFVSFLLPLMLISRIKRNRSRGCFNPLAEFKIGHFMNAAFEKILEFEQVLIESGFSFPLGGSLFLIAKRD